MKAKTNKCVFLDRDGTVIEDGEYAIDTTKLVLKPDAVKSLTTLPPIKSIAGKIFIIYPF